VSYLVDTDCIIDYLNGDRRTIELFDSLAGSPIGMSLVTYGEVYDGVYHGRNPDESEEGFLRLLQVIDIIDLNEAIMRRFARIRGALRKTGQSIGDPDIMIAATALHHDLTLVTRNLDHFRRVPGLKIYGET
jgi:predicted nucleic acid-binding protein